MGAAPAVARSTRTSAGPWRWASSTSPTRGTPRLARSGSGDGLACWSSSPRRGHLLGRPRRMPLLTCVWPSGGHRRQAWTVTGSTPLGQPHAGGGVSQVMDPAAWRRQGPRHRPHDRGCVWVMPRLRGEEQLIWTLALSAGQGERRASACADPPIHAGQLAGPGQSPHRRCNWDFCRLLRA